MATIDPKPLIELGAFAWFLLCWAGYTRYAKRRSATDVCLASTMHMYRIEWMRAMLRREVRIADVSVLATFERNMAFFGSSSLLIVAGLLTLLGNLGEAVALLANVPFTTEQSLLQWEAKLLLLIVMFVYTFFKFSWAMRQIGFASVLMGAAPDASRNEVSEEEQRDSAERLARLISMAAHHFNFGVRAYYFALAVLAWFVNAWIFMGTATVVVYVLYRREFKSSALKTLTQNTTR